MNRISARQGVTLYHQAYLMIRERILSGIYPTGAMLPPDTVLCEELGVSLITMKRAMRELVAEGHIVRRSGRGTTVLHQPAPQNQGIDELIDSVATIGRTLDLRRLEAVMEAPSSEAYHRLNCRPGDQVLRIVQLRLSSAEPIGLITAVVPAFVATKLREVDGGTLPVLAWIRKSGIELARADQAITATLAEPDVAQRLDIEAGTPLIRLTRLVYDGDGRPVEWMTALYRADRYAYRTSYRKHGLVPGAWQSTSETADAMRGVWHSPPNLSKKNL